MRTEKITCTKCPSRDRGALGSLDYCEEAHKHIRDVNVLPKWRPRAKRLKEVS